MLLCNIRLYVNKSLREAPGRLQIAIRRILPANPRTCRKLAKSFPQYIVSVCRVQINFKPFFKKHAKYRFSNCFPNYPHTLWITLWKNCLEHGFRQEMRGLRCIACFECKNKSLANQGLGISPPKRIQKTDINRSRYYHAPFCE